MIEELSEYLKDCSIEVLTVKDLEHLPVASADEHKLILLPAYNLIEMMEEAVGDEGSLSTYVQSQLKMVHQQHVDHAWQRIVEAQLYYLDIPEEQKSCEGKAFDELYAMYSAQWEGNELLDERVCASETQPFQFNTAWVKKVMAQETSLMVLTLPVKSGYEAPLWLPMGGFNDCPLPLDQSVVFKYFQEKYDMKPLAVSDDLWVVQAGRLPQTEAEALKLAKEHFMFCSYVLETYPTLGQYANYLMNHNVWYFWWD